MVLLAKTQSMEALDNALDEARANKLIEETVSRHSVSLDARGIHLESRYITTDKSTHMLNYDAIAKILSS